jgi:hypothetical protein
MIDVEVKYNLETAVAACRTRGIPLAVAQFSHPSDGFLFVVLIELEWEYVVWTLNVQTGGFSYGSYFPFDRRDNRNIKVEAFRRYEERMSADFQFLVSCSN